MKFHFLLSVCLAFSFASSGQATELSDDQTKSLREQEAALVELSYEMHTDSSDDARFLACKELIKGLVEALKTPNSYRYPFDSLRGVVIKESPDQKFRLFTWELHVNADTYRHYGAIQMNTTDLQLQPLLDRGAALRENPENAAMSAENWLGYVVYDIIPAGGYDGQPAYFIFGFDRYAKWSRRKVLDVLTFGGDGNANFGAPVFKTYTEGGFLVEDRKRIIINYGAEGNVTLKYEPETNRVIYENVVMVPGTRGSGPVNMPDGSYRALELNDEGIWVENDRLFTHKYKEAPREEAKSSAGQDIIGRQKSGGQ
ncbi:hypothetical protein [Neolewinella antarctica]|uniref:Uncharacterized protein n=1 Tax=Neolewinella antarctica TaxID=442734 RepID=A0ABX0X7D7_9BACT|nr:hypothetical protein [Neolewinella antarctica]NJC24899.1 hypothetical protein [Neolewinella antarctica]